MAPYDQDHSLWTLVNLDRPTSHVLLARGSLLLAVSYIAIVVIRGLGAELVPNIFRCIVVTYCLAGALITRKKNDDYNRGFLIGLCYVLPLCTLGSRGWLGLQTGDLFYIALSVFLPAAFLQRGVHVVVVSVTLCPLLIAVHLRLAPDLLPFLRTGLLYVVSVVAGGFFAVTTLLTTGRLLMAERASTAALDHAVRAMNTQSEFVANMSHEVRTPMNGILGLAQIVLKGDLDPKQREQMETLHSSARSLLRVLDGVLELSKMGAGHLTLERRVFDPGDLVQTVVDLFVPKAAEKGLSLVAEVAPDLPGAVEGDPGRLRQVLMNLVGNALKFTDDGGVTVRLSSQRVSDHQSELVFQVRDTGIGLTEEQRSRVFGAFAQADGSISRRYGGTGLGLAISAQLVELMGGEITVDSVPDEGSTFGVTLRLAHASPDDLIDDDGNDDDERELSPSEAPRPLQVLLVDDNEVNRMVAKTLIEAQGHIVHAVASGAAALAFYEDVVAGEGALDVVLMDVQMPEMDGLEATRRIREREAEVGGHTDGESTAGSAQAPGSRPLKTPIIALTAHALAEDRQRCLAAGMDAYVTKPVDTEKLFDAIDRLVHP